MPQYKHMQCMQECSSLHVLCTTCSYFFPRIMLWSCAYNLSLNFLRLATSNCCPISLPPSLLPPPPPHRTSVWNPKGTRTWFSSSPIFSFSTRSTTRRRQLLSSTAILISFSELASFFRGSTVYLPHPHTSQGTG